MTKSKNIFINKTHGYISRAQFRKLGPSKKYDLMKAWFAERYQEPENEAFTYAIQDPREALGPIFSGIAGKRQIGIVAHDLGDQQFGYIHTRGYENQKDDPETVNKPSFQLGSGDERHYRGILIKRIEKLEEVLFREPVQHGLIGHNQPPGGVSGGESAALATLAQAMAEIKSELAKDEPLPTAILSQYDTAVVVQSGLRLSVEKKLGLATDEFSKAFGKELGKSLGKLAFWGPLLGALTGVMVWLEGWLTAIGVLF